MDKILIVENDPVICDFIARQTLQAAHYQTAVVNDASAAINRVMQSSPDVIIADLSLPGLSTQDMIVALTAQDIHTPVIALARQGEDAHIIQAIRLGAVDLLLWPFQEAEVITVVERALKQTHAQQERERLDKKLQEMNLELQQRVRELTTIYNVGKAVTSITDQNLLFEKILDGSVRVTQSDLGWFLLANESTGKFYLAAQRNLPPSLAELINQPWDDGISSLVSMSGETLAIHGDPLKRFKISSMGQATMVAPVKVQKQVIGLLVVMRKAAQPYIKSDQNLLEAVCDYASISLINARLFQAVETRAQSLQRVANSAQTGEKVTNEILEVVKASLRTHLNESRRALDRLAKTPMARWQANQRQELANIEDQMQKLTQIADAIQPLSVAGKPHTSAQVILNELAQQSVNRFQHFAQQNRVSLVAELEASPLTVHVDGVQISQVLDGLISNAIKYCNPGGRVTVSMARAADEQVRVLVNDTGIGIENHQIPLLFEPRQDGRLSPTAYSQKFAGLGIRLPLIKHLVAANQGSIWVESHPGQGTTFTFALPLVQ